MLATQQAIDQIIIAARTGNTAKIAFREMTGTSLVGLESTILAEAAQHNRLNVLEYMEATSQRVADGVEGILDYPLYVAIKNNRIGFSSYIISKMKYPPADYIREMVSESHEYRYFHRMIAAQDKKV